MKYSFLVLRAKLIALFVCFAALFSASANADSSGVIKIPTHNWSSQLVGAEVVGELFKMVGEKIEYVSMDSQIAHLNGFKTFTSTNSDALLTYLHFACLVRIVFIFLQVFFVQTD